MLAIGNGASMFFNKLKGKAAKMANEKFVVKKVAVLGAGVMGAQIAGQLANAKVETLLFDLPAKEGPKNSIVETALKRLQKIKPAPLASREALDYIIPANYEDNLDKLEKCDIVIEAVAERLDIKESVYKQVGPHLGAGTIFATNTSGISIRTLSEKFPASLKHRFCGVHFFNPPRYMHLVELIPSEDTEKVYLDELENFLVSVLGKGVVRAKDTPNFIANRLGVFSMLSAIHNAEKYGLSFDVVDDLTGRRLGRPKSATFRTADVVGLDTFYHVAKTMEDNLPKDPWHPYFAAPKWLTHLIEQKKLGAKTGEGIYKKVGKKILLWNDRSGSYDESSGKGDLEVIEILKIRDPQERFKKLRDANHPQAEFLWRTFADTFHYVAYHAAEIANNARDIDFAIRWGFGWDLGPLETWQSAGIQTVKKWLEEDIEKGKTMVKAPLPDWLNGLETFHNDEGSFNFNNRTYDPRSDLPVYHRQMVPPKLLGESSKPLGDTVWENAAVRAFTVDKRVLVIQNLNKNHAVSEEVLKGFNHALDMAEKEFEAVVLWNDTPPFSVGADLKSMMPAFEQGNFASIEKTIKLFQDTSMRLRYSSIPVVAAVQGFALGGGCEFTMHSNLVVAALESYIGLVEVGVGLLPAGGGTKEFALKAAEGSINDLFAVIKDYYLNIATARVAGSALEAKELGFLRSSDVVVFNIYELLYVALKEAITLVEEGFRPGVPRRFKVGGRTLAATIQGQLVNMKEGHFISDYDYYIALKIAQVISGGDITPGSIVDEQWILDLERAAFIELLQQSKTQERIQGMMTTGKPVRN